MGIAASATSDDQAAVTRRGRLLGFIAIGEVGVIAALILLVALFTAIEPAFISERNVRAILRVVSFVGIIAIGQTMLLVTGEFDLSVGSVAGLSAVVSAKLMTAAALPVPVAILGGLLTGALVGLVNGTRGGALPHPRLHPDAGHALHRPGPDPGRHQRRAGLSAAALGRRLRHGRAWSSASAGASSSSSSLPSPPISSCGAPSSGATCTPPAATPRWRGSSASTPTATRSAPSSWSARSPAIAGMFVMADLASGTTSIGSGWELTVIAGVVVGGVSLFGGAGTLAGGIVGVLLLQVVTSGLVVIGVSSNWQQIAVGVIMVLAVGLDIARRRYFIAGAGRRKLRENSQGRHQRRRLAAERNPEDETPIESAPRSAPPRSRRSLGSAGVSLAQEKALLWVQPMRDHPVHRLMQAGFLAECKKLGYTCEVVGNPSATN